MRNRPFLLSLLFVSLAVGCARDDTASSREVVVSALPAATGHAAQPPDPDRIERGRYLVTAMGCNDCHTPWHMGPNGPEPDMSRMLSGHPADLVMPDPPQLPADSPWGVVSSLTNTAWAGPWGISYTANLTPDPSGLIAWDDDIFIRTMRTGRHWGTSRPILPPMPWEAFRNLTDEDLRSMFNYLQSIPPIRNHVPEPLIAGAGNIVAGG